MPSPLVAYVFTAMVAWIPMSDHASFETPEVTRARYQSIAEDTVAIVLEEPPVEGLSGHAETALLMASIASYESSYAARVDDCRVGLGGAWGIWQITVPKVKACSGRRVAGRIALAMVRDAFRVCRRDQKLDRLALYTDGFCRANWDRSRWRVGRAVRYLAAHPFIETAS